MSLHVGLRVRRAHGLDQRLEDRVDAPLGAEPGESPPDADTGHRRVGGLARGGRYPGPLGPCRPDPGAPGPAGDAFGSGALVEHARLRHVRRYRRLGPFRVLARRVRALLRVRPGSVGSLSCRS